MSPTRFTPFPPLADRGKRRRKHKNRHRTTRIANVSKVGVGTWELDATSTSLEQLDALGVRWYYNWSTTALADDTPGSVPIAEFVPMIWGAANVAEPAGSSPYLLGFNEPDNVDQSNISVSDALNLWPTLAAKGKELGSPSPTTDQTLGGSWLESFMNGNPAVWFMAVHHYTTNTDVSVFRQWLISVYNKYQLPIWVTEWALIDWNDLDRFTVAQVAEFVKDACLMMDKLDFVERHAWFAAPEFTYGGLPTNTHLYASNVLTSVGTSFRNIIAGATS